MTATMDPRRRIVGIDFGTTTTLIAERVGAVSSVIPIGEATSFMPSVVGFDGDRLLVGEAALRLPVDRVVHSSKSALTGGERSLMTPVGEMDTTVLVSAILSEALERAERARPGLFDDAEVYLGCPALWTGSQRRALAQVAVDAGLDVDVGQIVDEPVAAGLHWIESRWVTEGVRPSGKSLIFDAGGGTLDVALLDVKADGEVEVIVCSAEGVPESGDALDRSVARHLEPQLGDTARDATAQLLLADAARRLKESLSRLDRADRALGAPFEHVVSITREELDLAFADQLQRAGELVCSTVRGGQLRVRESKTTTEIREMAWTALADEVNHVALVGGLSQVPSVSVMLTGQFPSALVELVERPQESVVLGLTYSDQLRNINLPRPPVDFIYSFEGRDGHVLAPEHVAYPAFTPLYTWASLMRGESQLRFINEVPTPEGFRRGDRVAMSCVIPGLRREPLRLKKAGTAAAVESIVIQPERAGIIRFSLYTSGVFRISAPGVSFEAKIDSWPSFRGADHDYSRDLELLIADEMKRSRAYPEAWRDK